MRFIELAKDDKSNVGTYILTISLVFLALLVGQFTSELIATRFLGFSIIQLPDWANLSVVLILLLIPFVVILATLLFSLKVFHKRKLLTLFTSRDHFDWRRYGLSFFIWGTIMTGILFVNYLLGAKLFWNFDQSKFWTLLLVSFTLLPLQTAAEDLFFRSFLLQGFQKSFGKVWLSILLTGILFGLMHAGNPEVGKLGNLVLIYYIGTGLFLSLLTHMDDGMELGMGYHAANNIFAALIVTNNWQAFQTDALIVDHSDPVFGWDNLITLFVLQPLLLLLFSRIYRWNFRGKS